MPWQNLKAAAILSLLVISTISDKTAALDTCPNSNEEIAEIPLLWPLSVDDRARLGRSYADYVKTTDSAPYRFHSGIDIGAPTGTVVRAAALGEVVLIQENDTNCITHTDCQDRGFGTTIILRHTSPTTTFYTQYSHLSSVQTNLLNACGPPDRFRRFCPAGVAVTAGEAIALSGATANGELIESEHLHFEVKDNGWIAATGNDSGPFAYSLEHPDLLCYHNPVLSIHMGDFQQAPILVSVNHPDVNARVGPGGAGNKAYRSTGNLELSSNPFRLLATAGPTVLPECSGWYYLTKNAWTGACDTPDSCFADPAQGTNARIPAVWSCKDYLTSAAVPLNVVLSTNPSSGPSPLSVIVTATVSGMETGTINYSFWWDCNVSSNSVSNVMAQCGYIPTPPPGGCSQSAAGVKCNALTLLTHSETHIYSSAEAGSRTIKVIVERGNSPPVEARKIISVGCAVPPPPTLVYPVGGATGISPAPLLQWQPVDGVQGYDVNICRDSDCSILVNSIRVPSAQWGVTPPLPALTTFYWRISAFNSSCGNGPWSDGAVFSTIVSEPDQTIEPFLESLGPSGTFTTASPGLPDFSLSCMPTDLSAPAGGGDGTICTVTSIDGFAGQVTLSDESLPQGISASSTNWNLQIPPNGSQSTAIGVNTSVSTNAGTYPFDIKAVGSSVSHSVNLSMTVQDGPDFQLACSPSMLSVASGQNGSTTCTVSSLRGFSGVVNLSDSGGTSGLLSFFDTQTVFVPVDGSASTALLFTVGATVLPGAYEISVIGSSDTFTHSTPVTINVVDSPDFSITCDPQILSTVPGGAATSNCTVAPRAGFSAAVSLACQAVVPSIVCAFSPNPATPASGPAGSILTVTVPSSIPPGYTYIFLVRGDSGGLEHTFNSGIAVAPTPAFEISCSPEALGVVPGESGSSTCTIRSVNNFSGDVSLGCSSPQNGVSCSLAPLTVNIPAGGTADSILSIPVDPGVAAGNIELSVSGSHENFSHSTTISLSILGSGELWSRSYQSDDELSSTVAIPNVGSLMAGSQIVNGGLGVQGYLMRLDLAGNVLWRTSFKGSKDFVRVNDVATTPDGSIVIGSILSEDPDCGEIDLWIAKVDSSGTLVWQQRLGVCGSSSQGLAIIATADGGYLVAGDSPAIGAGGIDYWILKLNPAGSIAWQCAYGGPSFDRPLALRQTMDGGFIAAGYTASFGAGGLDAWIIKLDEDGNIQWQKAYGGAGLEGAYGVEVLNDGGYLVANRADGFGSSGRWILRLDAIGNVVWQKIMQNSNGFGIDTSQDRYFTSNVDGNSILVAGDSAVFGSGAQVWLTEIDSSGNVLWQRIYQNGSPAGVSRTGTNGWIVSAQVSPFAPGGPALLGLSLDRFGGINSCPFILDTSTVPSDTNGEVTETTALTTVTSLVPVPTQVVAVAVAAPTILETCNSRDPSFVIFCTPSSLVSSLGGTVNSSCMVSSLGGFGDEVSLACTGLPSSISCTFSSANVIPMDGSPALSVLSLNVTSGAVPGSYPFEISGSSGTHAASVTATLSIPSPILSSVSPTEGPSIGGTTVTINGAHFSPGMSLIFGGAPGASLLVISPFEATATTTAHNPGTVNVEVVNPDGQVSVLQDGFTYFDNTLIFMDGFESGDVSHWSSSVP